MCGSGLLYYVVLLLLGLWLLCCCSLGLNVKLNVSSMSDIVSMILLLFVMYGVKLFVFLICMLSELIVNGFNWLSMWLCVLIVVVILVLVECSIGWFVLSECIWVICRCWLSVIVLLNYVRFVMLMSMFGGCGLLWIVVVIFLLNKFL